MFGVKMRPAVRMFFTALFAAWLLGCQKDPFTGYSCTARLRIIAAAKDQWGLDRQKSTNDIPTWDDLRPYLSRKGDIPVCPAGGKYTLGRLDQQPTCSYPDHKLE